jgi:carbamate kinase
MIAPTRGGRKLVQRSRGIVVALGGNALAPADEAGTIAEQFEHTRQSLGAVVALARAGWRMALVHGNGPQVGNALVRKEMARAAAAVLARDLDADLLLILTDVEGVLEEYGTPRQRLLWRLPLGRAERMLASGELGSGSMAPKVEAAVSRVREGGRAIIARLDQGEGAVGGTAGTEITK